MTSDTRLKLCVAMVVTSAAYGVIISKDPSIASALAVGYIAVVLTFYVITNLKKKP